MGDFELGNVIRVQTFKRSNVVHSRSSSSVLMRDGLRAQTHEALVTSSLMNLMIQMMHVIQ